MILRHRDRELLRFEWVEPQGVRVVSVNDAERKFLPLEMHGVASDETLWMCAAPIFDNGYGLFSLALYRPGQRHDEFSDLRKFIGHIMPALYERWLGFSGGVTQGMMKRLETLKGFRFKRHKYYNLPVDRLHKIEDFLQKRVSEIIEYGVKADRFISLSGKECTVNHADGSVQCTRNSDSLSEQIKQNIRADPFITKIELSEILQVSPRWIARKMKDLQSAGEIRRVGADKNGHWEIVSSG